MVRSPRGRITGHDHLLRNRSSDIQPDNSLHGEPVPEGGCCSEEEGDECVTQMEASQWNYQPIYSTR